MTFQKQVVFNVEASFLNKTDANVCVGPDLDLTKKLNKVEKQVEMLNVSENIFLENSGSQSRPLFCSKIYRRLYLNKVIEFLSLIALTPSVLCEMLVILLFTTFLSLRLPCFQRIKEFEEDISLQTNIYEETRRVFTDDLDENENETDTEWETISSSDYAETIEEEYPKDKSGTLIVIDQSSKITVDQKNEIVDSTSTYKYHYPSDSELFLENMYEKLDELRLDCMNNHMELCGILTEDVESTNEKLGMLFKKIEQMIDVKMKEKLQTENLIGESVENLSRKIEGIMFGMQINLNKITKENQKIKYLLKSLQQKQE